MYKPHLTLILTEYKNNWKLKKMNLFVTMPWTHRTLRACFRDDRHHPRHFSSTSMEIPLPWRRTSTIKLLQCRKVWPIQPHLCLSNRRQPTIMQRSSSIVLYNTTLYNFELPLIVRWPMDRLSVHFCFPKKYLWIKYV